MFQGKKASNINKYNNNIEEKSSQILIYELLVTFREKNSN